MVGVQIEHPEFGGTTSMYSAEAAERSLAVCRLLKQQRGRNFQAVRFWLWIEGFSMEVGLLKESIWNLTPFSSWKEPETSRKRQILAQRLAQQILNAAWKSFRPNFARKVLQNFESREDQQWFLNLATQLLYGIAPDRGPDFTRDHLNEGGSQGQLEEPADILAHGLQTKYVRSLPEDLAEISTTVRINWPIFKRMQEYRATLQHELPEVAREIPSLPTLGKLLVEGTPQERAACLTHQQDVYQQHKKAFDDFWQRHPALREG